MKTAPAPGHTEWIEFLVSGPGSDLLEASEVAFQGLPVRTARKLRLPGEHDPLDPPEFDPDLALVDEEPDPAFASRLSAFKHRFPRCQVLLVGREDSALNPQRLGSTVVRHWFFRPVARESLLSTLAAAGRSLSRSQRETERHARSLTTLEAFLGRAPALQESLDLARRVAESPSTAVLILGETGTGKGLLARAIHGESPVRGGPFVEINCAAIPTNLLESELFGHRKGAFTSATRDKPGLLELADGGSAFLDEIGELEPMLQVKLLKFLDDGSIRPLAASSSIRVRVRMIAATNRDLESEVRDGRFRLDLYHRLSVMTLRLPPLRERMEDIPLLAAHFLAEISKRQRGVAMEWSPEALDALCAYGWPGNVRELVNLAERIALLAPPDRPVAAAELPLGFRPETPLLRFAPGQRLPEVNLPPGGVPFDQIERAVLEAALREARGNITRAAALLGMGRGGLRYRMERLGLAEEVPRRRGRPMKRARPRAA